jgi:hypothetical protein
MASTGLYWHLLADVPTRRFVVMASGYTVPAAATHFALSCEGSAPLSVEVVAGATAGAGCALLALPSLWPLGILDAEAVPSSPQQGLRRLGLEMPQRGSNSSEMNSEMPQRGSNSSEMNSEMPLRGSNSSEMNSEMPQQLLESDATAAEVQMAEQLAPVDAAALEERLRTAVRFRWAAVLLGRGLSTATATSAAADVASLGKKLSTATATSAAADVASAVASSPAGLSLHATMTAAGGGVLCVGMRRPMHVHAVKPSARVRVVAGGRGVAAESPCAALRLHTVFAPPRLSAPIEAAAVERTDRLGRILVDEGPSTGGIGSDGRLDGSNADQERDHVADEPNGDHVADEPNGDHVADEGAPAAAQGQPSQVPRNWARPPPRLSLRLLHWNVLDGCSLAPHRLGGIGRWIISRGVDVLSLNEMNGWTDRHALARGGTLR